jgi:anthranilate phosphoribosyltransferase
MQLSIGAGHPGLYNPLVPELLEQLTQQINTAQTLGEAQVCQAVEQLASEKVSALLKADFLAALSKKGETPGEIAAFARALREMSIQPPIEYDWRASREILDVVGTGGDRLSTFNISTTVAILCAAAGVAVAKHGNRAMTSSVGSADVIEALGIRVDLSPADAAQALRELGFAFFFAPNFHPAFKNIAPARKLCAARGQRTIFNLLGPLLNPARPSAMLVGVPRPELCEPMARALQSLGARRGMAVCGSVESKVQSPKSKAESDLAKSAIPAASKPCEDGRNPQSAIFLDELSTLGANTIAEFYQERGFAVSTLSPENFPLQPATLADLRGGDKIVNAEIIRRILRGDERGPKRDAVLFNAAAALFVAGGAKSLAEGWDLAVATIDGGKAGAKLAELAR